MPKINPHIHFNGNTEEAFEFYQSAIGGELRGIMRFKDLQTEGFSFPEDELNAHQPGVRRCRFANR
ncbi:MAG: hypothetical protein RLZ91_1612 [Bacteroidota bacterium]